MPALPRGRLSNGGDTAASMARRSAAGVIFPGMGDHSSKTAEYRRRRSGPGADYLGLRQVKASGPRRSNAMCLDERFDQSQLRPNAPVTMLRAACPSVM